MLSGLSGFVFGAIGWCVARVLRGRRFARRAAEWWRRSTSRDAEDREPVIRLHAALLFMVAWASGCAWLARRLFTALLALQEDELGRLLVVVVSTSMVAAGMLGLAIVAPLLRRPLRALDRRLRLPWPPWAGARYLLYVAAPAFAGLTAFSLEYGGLLGRAGFVLAAPMVFVAAGWVVHLWRAVMPASRARRLAFGVSVVAGWALSLVVAATLRHQAFELGDRSGSPVVALGATLANAATSGAPAIAAPLGAGGEAATEELTSRGPFLSTRGAPGRRYNVVWIIVDALRADKVGARRGGRSMTPNLDRLARESVVFTRAFSQSTSTSYSIPSMLSGHDVSAIHWGWARNRPQLPASELTIAERLRPIGYRTFFVFSEFIGNSLVGIHQGYERTYVVHGPAREARLWAQRRSGLTTVDALSRLTSLAPGALSTKPFLLTVYYPDPHAPYRLHPEFGERFPDTSEGQYESEVAFTDLHLGVLLDGLRIRKALWDETIVIVTADHGEEFGEHGGRRHGHTCNEEVSHVPLLVRIPGVPATRVESPVALVDLVPTLIELIGAPRDDGALSGQSLLVPLHDPERVDRSRPIFCAAAHQRADQSQFLTRSVRQDGYTLIHRREEDVWSLFALDDDPGEQRNVVTDAANAGRFRRMRRVLEEALVGNIGQPAR